MNLIKVNPDNGELILQSLRDQGYTAGMILLAAEWRFREMLKWIEDANQIVTDKIVDSEQHSTANLRPYIGVFADEGRLDATQQELISKAGGVTHDRGEDPTSPEELLQNAASAAFNAAAAPKTNEVHSVTGDPTSAVSHIVTPSVPRRKTSSMLDDDPAGGLVEPRKYTTPTTGGYGS